MMDYAELPLTVLKFGGTSVAGPERMRHVARLVKKVRDSGYRVAVVVSAMGNMTDDLLAYSTAKMKDYGIVDSGDALKDGIGAMTEARVASFFDKMSRAGVVRKDIDFRKAYTLQFVNKGVGLNLRPKK